MGINVARVIRLLSGAMIAAAVTIAAVPSCAIAATPPASISAPSGLLMTMDGHLLWSRQPTESRHVASTIKMLNALVVVDHANLGDVVVVSRQAQISNGGVWLSAGQRLTVGQLLSIMLIHSANDAARALAIHVAGSNTRFVSMMNAKAAALGLNHTHAVDPDGLSGREVSDAQDLATLGRQVMANPVLRGIVGKASVPVPRPNGTSVVYASSDLLMGHYAGLEGVKTGFTSGAGFCYVGAARRNGVELLGVVLGTPSEAARFGQMRKLFDWGFAHCKLEQVVSAGETRVVGFGGHRITARASRAASAVVFDDGSHLLTNVESVGPASASGVGHVADLVVSQDGAELARVPLLSGQDGRSASAHHGGTAVLWLGGVLSLAVLGAVALVARRPLSAILRRTTVRSTRPRAKHRAEEWTRRR